MLILSDSLIDWLIDWLADWMDGWMHRRMAGWLDYDCLSKTCERLISAHLFVGFCIYIYISSISTPQAVFFSAWVCYGWSFRSTRTVFFLFGVNNIRGLQTFFGAKKRWVNLNKTVGPKKCPIEAQERGWNRCVSWNQPSGAALLLGPWYLTACQVKEIGHADAWHGTWA